MILIEIQENITKTQNSLSQFESNPIYKVLKTVGGSNNFEHELRAIQKELIGLRNSFISHSEAIIRISENKDLLMLIDSGYFERYANAASVESLIRVVSGGGQIPETSIRVVAENRLVINELQAINIEIQRYNNTITNFRHKSNKYFLTLYKVPKNNELPDIILGIVNLEGVLPNAHFLNNYTGTKTLTTPKKADVVLQSKSHTSKINITEKSYKSESKPLNITKKK